ncbi:putative ABC transport system permease protein [Jatrophihabitans endophyticus]|uniref:Putative ABC transport system permease protein n=1 Tax=Jatrophihabitans endophyticus TaxID=1206085 RepID=A0A1M5CL02_9ACTN|nr:FtsX-like permease family protein [Jatrophihabitans endophyticus]SHF55388.1 putative ABC transport system permease protein [Jatrophihabitans endophyticus]
MSAATRRAAGVVTAVSALGAAQGVAIVMQIGATGDAVGAGMFGAGATAQLVLGILTVVFLTVAVTVTAVVVAGATEVVLTGQLREIALRRLLGAAARDERDRVRRAVMRRAVVGVAGGAVLGYGVSAAVLAFGVTQSREFRIGAAAFVPSPLLLVALGAQLVVTRGAVRRGTAVVLTVAPVAALRLSAEADAAVTATLAVPRRAAAAVLGAGVTLLAFAVAASTQTPLAMVPAVVGGVVTFVGLVSQAHRFVPGLLAGLARVLPRGVALELARRTLLRHPLRTSRAVLGIAAAVTLVTTFAVGIASFQAAVAEHYEGSAVAGLAHDVLTAVVSVVLVLTVFLVTTATIALGNAMWFGGWTRRRETALRRVLGQPGRATRAGVLAESLLLTLTATVLGLVVGLAFGWVGAQSVFGVEAEGHLVVPVVPPVLVAGAVAGVGLLAAIAAVAPTRAALRLPPIRAYLAG